MTTDTSINTPLILALDSSQPNLSLALLQGTELLATIVDTSGAPHSQRLFPLLQEMLAAQSLVPADLDLLAVNTGPGSFTGLRVGLAAAQGLAATLRKPAFGINALDALAMTAQVPEVPTVVLINASRGELFGGVRVLELGGGVRPMGNDWVERVESLELKIPVSLANSEVVFIGNGAESFWEQLRLIALRGRLITTPDTLAPTIGHIALKQWQAGLLPTVRAYYIRPSEAELKFGKGSPTSSILPLS